jgi:surface polysaccharide O-acyltransferase-like enzyme
MNNCIVSDVTNFNFLRLQPTTAVFSNNLLYDITKLATSRIDYLDTLRVVACFLVVLCHVGDCYAESANGEFGLAWSKLITFTRPCVPLFILLSGTLLLPLKMDTRSFLKRRFTRVVIPFLIWSVLYVFFPIPSGNY